MEKCTFTESYSGKSHRAYREGDYTVFGRIRRDRYGRGVRQIYVAMDGKVVGDFYQNINLGYDVALEDAKKFFPKLPAARGDVDTASSAWAKRVYETQKKLGWVA
jgi:hypothetical protein